MLRSRFSSRLAPMNTLLGAVVVAGAALATAQAAGAATVTCGAINATSIINGVLPSPSCGNIQSGDTFEISFNGILSVNDSYALEVANLSTGGSNTQAFSNVQFLVTGAIGSTSFNDQAITIWPDSTNAGTANDPNSPAFSQGLTGYTTSGTAAQFGSPAYDVQPTAAFSLTGPNAPTGLGTAGLVITEPLQLGTAGITSFTGFKIRGTFTGSGPFAAGLGIYAGAYTPGAAPSTILGNAYNIPAPAPLPLLGAGAAFGWSSRLRRRIAIAGRRSQP